MTVKSEVQGVVQALFGAYAGGYLAELTAEATANGTGAVAARLASVQGIILGKDLSTTKAFVDTILGNMGVSSTNAAYAAASKWATDELTAGASRADVVSAAVAFLSGIAAGTIVDTKYAAIATAFAAKVTAGVTYSETVAGAKVLSVTALQTAAGFTAPTNLSDMLDALSKANADVEALVDAWGLKQDPVIKAKDSTAAQLTQSVENAEANLNSAADPKTTAGASKLGVTQAYNDNAETTLGSSDVVEDAQLIIVKTQIAAKAKALTTATKSALDALTLKAAALPAAVANLSAAETAQVAAEAAAAKADIASKTAASNLTVDGDAVLAGTVFINGVTGNSAQPNIVLIDGVHGQAPVTIATYTKATGAWVVAPAYKTLDLKAVQAAVVAQEAAMKAALDAAALVDARFLTIESIDATQVDRDFTVTTIDGSLVWYATTTSADADTAISGSSKTGWTLIEAYAKMDFTADQAAAIDTNSTLATRTSETLGSPALTAGAEADDYNTALADQKAFNTAKAAFDKAEAAVTAVRAEGASLVAAQKVVSEATKALTDAGYNVVSLVNGDVKTATSKADVYTLGSLSADNQTASINDFGFAGDDVLYFGTKYTFNAGKMTTAGNDAVLEVFAKQSGANVVLSFETVAFGSNVGAGAAPEAFDITLTGVALTDLTISNGFVLA